MSRRAPIVLAATILLVLAAAAPAGAATPHWYGLLHAINRTRAAHYLRPVHPAPRLHWAARGHSRDMLVRQYFAHTSPTGSTLYDRIVHSGFRTYGAWTAGETLAWGTGTMGMPSSVVRMWLASPEHRAILLSPLYGWVGIGRAYGRFEGHRNTRIWTVDWGQR
jgi:uncharacterized protein YkwD